MQDPIIRRVWESVEVLDVLRILTGAEVDLLRLLQMSLIEASDLGEGFRKIANRVQALLDTDRISAMLVARNTVGYVLSRARYEHAVGVGLTHKTWLDGGKCPCAGHDVVGTKYAETPIRIQEEFVVNGTLMRYPRDFSCGCPQECVGCECLMIAKYQSSA